MVKLADGVFGHGLMRTVRQLFLPASPFTDRRSLLLSVGLSLLFTALMVPSWLDALSKLDPGTAAWSKVIGVAYAAAYMAFVLIGRLEAWLPRALLCVATMALGTALVVLMGLDDAWLLMFALCVILAFARRTVALTVVALALLGVVLAGLATGSLAEALPNLVVLGSVSVAIGLLAWLFDVNNELRHARDQIATLAVDREREREVLSAVGRGRSIADVAKILHLAEGTVRNHLSAAIGKTGTRSRGEASLVAQERGWL
ncbi:LuxR C-terminal-related transcriptional regulator [Nonomuraea sp. B19D2]|uniref:helix-turn-helix transcriptional regulator n=1 Tax=Nonomuraea sp. B19D2 TaxID=3159561 RepID=UPI0032DAE80C